MKKEEALEVVVKKEDSLILEGNPEAQLEYASKAAKALMQVAKPINIQGKKYLQYGSWQVLGRFFGATAGVEWTKKIEENGKLLGYEARAVVYRNGVIISSAEASCMKTEKNWATRDEYAVKSMAQTRACAKALRNGFGWVAEMGGYSATPAEEMDADSEPERVNYRVERKAPAEDDEPNSKQFLTPEEIEASDEMKVAEIRALMGDLGYKKPKPSEIEKETGIHPKTKKYDAIIETLKKKSPLEKATSEE